MIHETDCCNLALSVLLKKAGYDDYTEMRWQHNYRVRDEMYEKHPDLSDDGYHELQKEWGGPYETDEVYGFYDEILRYGNKNSWDEYNVIASAPTLAEAATWLRKRGLIAEARYNDVQKSWDPMFFNGTYWERPRIGNYTIRNESYEAAMCIALEYAVKYYISNKTVEGTK